MEGEKNQDHQDVYFIDQIGATTWKIIEQDNYGQYPIIYAIKSESKIIIVDTGCGTGNMKEFIDSKINPDGLPYLVICTHIHFDHIGGCHCFSQRSLNEQGEDDGEEEKRAVVYMGGAAQDFTKDWRKSSLAEINSIPIPNFKVDSWLQEGSFVYLSDDEPAEEHALEVIYTPGHTPDHIALYHAAERRMFVGDSIYRWTPIYMGEESSFSDYLSSLLKLVAFLEERKGSSADEDKNEITLSCGHVDHELPASAVQELLELVLSIQSNSIIGVPSGGDMQEFSNGTFSITMPASKLYELQL